MPSVDLRVVHRKTLALISPSNFDQQPFVFTESEHLRSTDCG